MSECLRVFFLTILVRYSVPGTRCNGDVCTCRHQANLVSVMILHPRAIQARCRQTRQRIAKCMRCKYEYLKRLDNAMPPMHLLVVSATYDGARSWWWWWRWWWSRSSRCLAGGYIFLVCRPATLQSFFAMQRSRYHSRQNIPYVKDTPHICIFCPMIRTGT